MRDKKLEEMRQDYENVKIPAQLRERVDKTVSEAGRTAVTAGFL